MGVMEEATMDRPTRLISALTALVLTTSACAGAAAPTSSTIAEESQAATSTTMTTTTVPTTTAAPVETTTIATTTTTTPAMATTVEVNGTNLSYECLGEGSPTALVEMGMTMGGMSVLGDYGSTYDPAWLGWSEALDGIGDLTQVCIYGRRGVAGSDPLPIDTSRTTQDQVDDLDALIVALGIETPLVLVGHSVAGYNLRVFADRYPEKVAGLVFVDALHPGIVEFEDSPPPPQVFEWLDFPTSEEQVNATSSMGDLPLYVITATIGAPDWWLGLQEELVALSTNSIQMMSDSDHIVQLNDPESIIAGVSWVLQQVG